MKVEDLVSLLVAELKDDVMGTIRRDGDTIVLIFADGTKRTITVA